MIYKIKPQRLIERKYHKEKASKLTQTNIVEFVEQVSSEDDFANHQKLERVTQPALMSRDLTEKISLMMLKGKHKEAIDVINAVL